MSPKLRNELIVCAVATLCALLVVLPTFVREGMPSWWPSKAINLGLDLQGGAYFRFTVKTEDAVASQVATTAGMVRAGLRERKASVVRARATSSDTFEVTMLGGDAGVQAARDFVREEFPVFNEEGVTNDGSQSRISFKVQDSRIKEIEHQAVNQAIETVRKRVDMFGVAEPLIQRQGEKDIIVQLPGAKDASSVEKLIGRVAKLEFRLVADPSRPSGEGRGRMFKSRQGAEEKLEEDVLMYGDAIENASAEFNPSTNEVYVSFVLNSLGAKTFARATSENVGRRLAIVLDNIVESSPVINSPITGGHGQITGRFSYSEASELALVLRSGALPAPLITQQKNIVGATLGADAVRTSFNASAIGLTLIALTMIVYYRKSGLVSVVCLVINGLMVMALLSLFGATLTLPGVAGIALTIGMAVDASILIFERMREEMRNGASGSAVVDAGFTRAHWVVLDSNLTTLLAGVILYYLGTGPVRGFAVTLSIGILTTLFTALFVCRVFMQALDMRDRKGTISV